MKRSFTKMHGLGNDFVIIDCRKSPCILTKDQIVRLSDRRFGIGCDQLILLESPAESSDADVFMRIFNADGSEVEACGNATRCVGLLLSREEADRTFVVETVAGILKTQALGEDRVTVDLGRPKTAWSEIPLSQDVDTLHLPISCEGLSDPVAVNVGNPHMVFFVYDVESIDIDRLGAELTKHPLYPNKANVEVVEVLDQKTLRMRVYERGVGVTPACGTGASASVVAALRRGLIQSPATVILDGGRLKIEVAETVRMTGRVTLCYEGVFQDSIFQNAA